MADTRYLRRRGNVYWTRVKVPADLRQRVHKEHLEKSLGTGDLRKAQRLRWAHVHEAQEAFSRLRGRRGLSSAEIERAAQKRRRAILEDAAYAAAHPEPVDPGNEAAVEAQIARATRAATRETI